MSLASKLVDRLIPFRHATVAKVEQVRPRIRRVRLAGPEIAGLDWSPGQHVRIRVLDENVVSRDMLRTYTIYDLDPAEQWLDLYVYQPGEESTPGLDWSRRVEPGAPVTFMGPLGRFVIQPDAPFHLVVGDETAQMAFAPMLATVSPDAAVAGVIEVATEAERLAIPRGDELTWTYRGTASAAGSATLLAAVADLPLPAHPGIAYVAGEAKTIAAVRSHLVNDRGWPRRSVLTKPFWTPGRKGMD